MYAGLHIEPLSIPLPLAIEIKEEAKQFEPDETRSAHNCYRLLVDEFGDVPTMNEIVNGANSNTGNIAVFMFLTDTEERLTPYSFCENSAQTTHAHVC
jgi:hypothetical protein